MDSFDVQIDQLLKHATTVADMADDARNAAATAQAALSGDAFGLFGQFLAVAILQASTEAKEALGKAAQTVADVNAGLLTTANAYQSADTRHATAFSVFSKEAK